MIRGLTLASALVGGLAMAGLQPAQYRPPTDEELIADRRANSQTVKNTAYEVMGAAGCGLVPMADATGVVKWLSNNIWHGMPDQLAPAARAALAAEWTATMEDAARRAMIASRDRDFCSLYQKMPGMLAQVREVILTSLKPYPYR